MTNLREAAQQALEALEWYAECSMVVEPAAAAMTALRAALAKEALQRLTDVQQEMERNFCSRCGKRTNGIHTCTPPAPLTDEVIAELWHKNGGFHHHFARAIERWLKGHA